MKQFRHFSELVVAYEFLQIHVEARAHTHHTHSLVQARANTHELNAPTLTHACTQHMHAHMNMQLRTRILTQTDRHKKRSGEWVKW